MKKHLTSISSILAIFVRSIYQRIICWFARPNPCLQKEDEKTTATISEDFDLEEYYYLDDFTENQDVAPEIHLLIECLRIKSDDLVRRFFMKKEDYMRVRHNMSSLPYGRRSLFKRHDENDDLCYENYIIEDSYMYSVDPEVSSLAECFSVIADERDEHIGVIRRYFTKAEYYDYGSPERIVKEDEIEDFLDQETFKNIYLFERD